MQDFDEIRCALCHVPLDDPLFTVPSDDGFTDWWVCENCYDGYVAAMRAAFYGVGAQTVMDEAEE